MMSGGIVGAIAGLWRFPVKSMQGEELQQVELTGRGLIGDRAYALIDAETGKVVSAKSVRLFPDVLLCQATFLEPPRSSSELPPVKITLPNGTTVDSDSSDCDRALSSFFRRDVKLSRSAPEDFTIDQYHPDVEGVGPAGRQNTVEEQRLGSAFFAQAGIESPVPVGAFFDLFPISVLTTSTLDRLNELQPETRFDQRRFRMNLIVGSTEPGFAENGWVGRELAIGAEVRLLVALSDPRCVMTTLAQSDLPADIGVLRTLAKHNKLQVAGAGEFPCAGVYAVAQSQGAIRISDPVTLT